MSLLNCIFQKRKEYVLTNIRNQAKIFSQFDNKRLILEAQSLKVQAKHGKSRDKILPYAYALVITACDKTYGLGPDDETILSAIDIADNEVIPQVVTHTSIGKIPDVVMPLFLSHLYYPEISISTGDYGNTQTVARISSILGFLGVVSVLKTDNESIHMPCDIIFQ